MLLAALLRDPVDRLLSSLHFFYGGRYKRWAKTDEEVRQREVVSTLRGHALEGEGGLVGEVRSPLLSTSLHPRALTGPLACSKGLRVPYIAPSVPSVTPCTLRLGLGRARWPPL